MSSQTKNPNETTIHVNKDQISFLDIQPRNEEEYDIHHPHMRSLMASIKAEGLLQHPLAIPDKKRGEGYYVIVGGRSRATAALIHLGMEEMPVTLRTDLDEAGAMRAAFEENFIRNATDGVSTAMFLHRMAEMEGENKVMEIQGVKPATLRLYLKIGDILSRLTAEQRSTVRKKAPTMNQLRVMKDLPLADDNGVLWQRVRDALGLSRAGQKKREEKKAAVRTITINGQQAEISIKPRTTTIHIKCTAETGNEIAQMLNGFSPAPSAPTSAPETPPSFFGRLLRGFRS